MQIGKHAKSDAAVRTYDTNRRFRERHAGYDKRCDAGCREKVAAGVGNFALVFHNYFFAVQSRFGALPPSLVRSCSFIIRNAPMP